MVVFTDIATNHGFSNASTAKRVCEKAIEKIGFKLLYLLREQKDNDIIFFDKKLLLLSDAIRVYFPVNQSKTITSVNVLTVSFYSEEMIAYVNQEISKVWDELAENNPSVFLFLVI